MNKKYIDRLQNRTAQLAIGASTLRSQGAPGVVETARTYMKKMQLYRLHKVKSEKAYQTTLNNHTGRLSMRFPGGAKGNWGAARKAINIFLRSVVYNRLLCDWYKIRHLEPWLEVPLDSYVVGGIKKDKRPNEKIPKWKSIKSLKKEDSNVFQQVAKNIARREGINRIHLDLKYWRRGKL